MWPIDLKTVVLNATAVILLIGAGLVHGEWTGRWRVSPRLAAMSSSFDSIPLTIGDWTGTDHELPSREQAMAGAVGCLSRRYSNPTLGVSVSVLLLCGLPGDISTHTPDVCYPGAGYTLNTPLEFDRPYGPDKRAASFQTGLATRGGTNPSTLRIFWSWNASKAWVAPKQPRWAFGSEPALCKLYVIRETSGVAVDAATDPSNSFMDVFLPELDRCVFSVAH